MNQLVMGAMLLTWCTGMLAGCATTDKKTSSQPMTAANSTKSRGVIYLMISGNRWNPPGEPASSLHAQRSSRLKPLPDDHIAAPQKITLVKVISDSGAPAGRSVVPVDSGDLIVRNLRKKLKAQGYTVISVRKLPDRAENGIDISWISAGLEQNSGLLTLAGECDLRMRLDLWRNGAKLVSHDYATTASDYSIIDQNQLLVKLLDQATENIAGQAVPNILNDISALHK